MLCHNLEVNEGILKEHGMDGKAVTMAYRKAVVEALKKLVARFVAERKWDGTRVLAINDDGTVVLQNRHGVIYTIRLPEMTKALKTLKGRWVLDGEVVYLDPNTGEELFTPSQRRCATQFPDWILREQFPVKMEAFDAPVVDSVNVEHRPYSERKDLLRTLLDGMDGTVEYVPFEMDLVKAWKEVVAKDREGLIAKDVKSPYEHDRSYSWLKVKNWRFMCYDIVGFTAGENARSPFFGSLVLAKDGKYVGCAGSGFDEWELRKLKDIFTDSETTEKPFSIGEPYRAVKVNVQALVKFYQMTDSGVMRFPIFITSN